MNENDLLVETQDWVTGELDPIASSSVNCVALSKSGFCASLFYL